MTVKTWVVTMQIWAEPWVVMLSGWKTLQRSNLHYNAPSGLLRRISAQYYLNLLLVKK